MSQLPQNDPKQPLYSGGDGSSVELAIVINTDDGGPGVTAEYAYLTEKHGKPGEGWSLEMQGMKASGDRKYDVLKIQLATGEDKVYFFDITNFFGKH